MTNTNGKKYEHEWPLTYMSDRKSIHLSIRTGLLEAARKIGLKLSRFLENRLEVFPNGEIKPRGLVV